METLIKFDMFLKELSKDNSRTYKMNLLKQVEDEDIKYILNFIFNPFIVTGISDKKLTRDVSCDGADYMPTLRDLLEYLKKFNTGKDENIAKIRYFEIINLKNNLDLINLLRHIITKNLQLGIDAITINKCIPNLIPTFNVMLANKYFEKPEVVEGKEFALTTKIDGGRIIALKEKGEVNFYTRAGQKYEGLVDLEKALREFPMDDICLDGEITLLDKGTLTSKEQYKETMKITRKDGDKHGVKMLVFDCMPVNYFKNQFCPWDYDHRRAFLDHIFAQFNTIYFEKLSILYRGLNTSEITQWLNYNISHGEEGIMINICDAPYEFKRTNNLLKVKKMNDIELKVVGFEEGRNKLKNKLGALVCEYKNNTIKIGSGFKEEERIYLWNNKDKFIGRYATIQYFEESYNSKNHLYSLRFPIFIDFREDIIY